MAFDVVVAAAIIKSKKVLLIQQRPDGAQPGKWGPPAGHLEGNESPAQAAIRETKEETNLDIEIRDLIECGVFTYEETDYAYAAYLAEVKNLKEIKIQEKEVADFKWVSLSDLKRNRFPLRKKFLMSALIKALTRSSSPQNIFNVYKIEK